MIALAESPIAIGLLLLLLAVLAGYFGHVKVDRAGKVVALMWILVVYISPIPQVVIHDLERRNPVIDLSRIGSYGNVRILILGGGHEISPELPALSQLTPSALARLSEGIRIHRSINGSKLICSGYSSSGRTSQAQMLALAALELGISPLDTLLIRSPSNTMEEAKAYKDRFGVTDPLILVTSAAHMFRAMLCFKAQGVTVVPAPTDFRVKPDPVKGKYSIRPSLEKLQLTSIALHEYGGLLALKVGYW